MKTPLKIRMEDISTAPVRTILVMVVMVIVILAGSFILSGGLARFSGKPTVTGTLSVTYSGLLTSSEKYSISISNVSGNLSLSNVRVSITDHYGTALTQTFNNGLASVSVGEAGSTGTIQKYVYNMAATGSGNYLTNTTIVTITVSYGTPTTVTKIALIDSLSDGTIGAWSPK